LHKPVLKIIILTKRLIFNQSLGGRLIIARAYSTNYKLCIAPKARDSAAPIFSVMHLSFNNPFSD